MKVPKKFSNHSVIISFLGYTSQVINLADLNKDKNLIKLETHIEDFMNRLGTKKMFNSDPTPLPDESYCDNWITNNGIEMLKNFPNNKPWHLVVNFVCPHDPWDITMNMKKSWEEVLFPKPFKGKIKSANEELKVRQNYAAMLENIDRNIGLFINEVKNGTTVL